MDEGPVHGPFSPFVGWIEAVLVVTMFVPVLVEWWSSRRCFFFFLIFENNPAFCRFDPTGVFVASVVAVAAFAVVPAAKIGKRAAGGRSMDGEEGDDDIELGAKGGARRLKSRIGWLLLLLASRSVLSTAVGECSESLSGCCCCLNVVVAIMGSDAFPDWLDALACDFLKAGEGTVTGGRTS
jgi:hypothetical protein